VLRCGQECGADVSAILQLSPSLRQCSGAPFATMEDRKGDEGATTLRSDRDPTDADGGPAGASRALLVANAHHAASLASALESNAYRVTVADTPSVAAGQFDVVIVDLALPRARAMVEQVRAADEAAAIVVVSDGNEAIGRELDVEDCIAADARPVALQRCIGRAVELRKLRTQLAASDARFHNIIERAADGILIVDAGHEIRFANPAAEQLLGRSAAELVGTPFGYACVTGETTEIDIVRRGGGEIVAELRISETEWEGEEAQLVVMRDVTDRRRAEERAERLIWERAAREHAEASNRRSRFLVEAGATLDSSLDPDATLVNLAKLIVPRVADWCMIDLSTEGSMRRVAAVHADPEKQRLTDELRLQYPPRHGSQQPAARVIASGVPELHQGINEDRLRAFALDDDHARLLRQLGVRSIMSVPLQARDRRLGAITFVCNDRDFVPEDLALAEEIGNRAGRALENARLYEAALAANRAKADFLAVMSHELRTPLNAILGYTQLLLEGITGKVDQVQRRHLERIHTSGAHLLQIIEEILAFASMEAGRTRVDARPVVLREIIDAVASMTEPLAKARGLQFVLDVHDMDAALFTDPVKVRQILINLVTNAVKFTDQGTVTLRAGLHDGQMVFAVADTGPGIEESDLTTIFEPFSQVERPLTRHAGGTGLGLTVSKRLANLLGGSIDVESTPNFGTTFTVKLPARYDLTD
jgi:signal transduction histidine kinase/PAS domain-containing protein